MIATSAGVPMSNAESLRLAEDRARRANWKRWGPYLSDRQWGTVREDYSPDGNAWGYFPHDHARMRAYRWGEDGLLGLCDRQCRLCFGLALWNERDPILKERIFGLTGPEGNHGEDAKEEWFFLDSTPTHSYMRALYKYPQAEFPYARLVEESRRRSRRDPEFELADTGIFDGGRYFDVFVEYAKASPDDVHVRVTIHNRGPDAAPLHVLPTLWFRNTWSWGRTGEGYGERPRTWLGDGGRVLAEGPQLGTFALEAAGEPEWLFTENESNRERLWGSPNAFPWVKDAFHDRVILGRDVTNPAMSGTKAAAWYRMIVPAGKSKTLRLRLAAADLAPSDPARTFAARIAEADAWAAEHVPPEATPEEARIWRQGAAGLLWTKQFYHFVVKDWLEGDPAHPAPPRDRLQGRNREWSRHLYNRDVVSMPDKWEYPWFAAWDLAFHMIPFARFDPDFAKSQLELFLREWYMHPNGQLPAYEWNFSDVNPPVHAWAAWRVYKMTGPPGGRDRRFLVHAFQKLLINFTWWVNRKDPEGKNLFAGGFLGLDNIGVFDRSRPLPTGGHVEQADGTAWMGFYCATMLAMALELARGEDAYEDLASKFFEHFVEIVDAINTLGGTGLWDEADGFWYDRLSVGGDVLPLRIRSMVGIIPLFAVEVLDAETLRALPGFRKRMDWFLHNKPDLARHLSRLDVPRGDPRRDLRMLAIPTRAQLERVLRYVLDEDEFLSPYGVRSLSRAHRDRPYVLHVGGEEHRVDYCPGESDTGMFGGNSNWRGPVWFPVNYLLIEALERYHRFYGDDFTVECPVGSGRRVTLQGVADELRRRLLAIFLPDEQGRRPFHGDTRLYAEDPHFRELVLFHEYFHGDTGKGLGATHQTGWTALVLRCIDGANRRG
ncbi:MAG: MGH1-like glycoside hydrolase domain-containing protein [Myxococcota bacterium]